MNNTVTLQLPHEADTLALGEKLASLMFAGAIIYLHGELGAGKTTLVRGFLLNLGWQAAVKSPTYTLVEPYHLAGKDIFHFDLYRLANPEELETLGIRDYMTPHAICLIEWPERGMGYLPAADASCYLSHADDHRQARLEAYSPAGSELIKSLKHF